MNAVSWSRASCSSVWLPQVINPRPSRETARPDRPRDLWCTGTRYPPGGWIRAPRASRDSARTGWCHEASVPCRRVDYFDAVVLGVVEGLTEFLPVSSTGHLTIAEKLLGLEVDDPAVTGYTAVIQMGAIAAVIVYFVQDIWSIIRAWTLGLVKSEYRGQLDHRMGWYVIVATIPVGVVGVLAKDLITGDLRSLWVVAIALIVWSAAMYAAERVARQDRPERDLGLVDAVTIGLAQALALVPGVSRSGATISVGLFRGLDRVTATKLSFFMSIPALLAAGIYELKDAFSGDIGAGEAIVGVVVAFLVAYASIAWLLRFVAHHAITWFVPYRVGLGLLLLVLLGSGVLSPT